MYSICIVPFKLVHHPKKIVSAYVHAYGAERTTLAVGRQRSVLRSQQAARI